MLIKTIVYLDGLLWASPALWRDPVFACRQRKPGDGYWMRLNSAWAYEAAMMKIDLPIYDGEAVEYDPPIEL